jgi:hypothetical protein
VETVISGILQPRTLLLDGSDIIFATESLTGTIERVAKTGGPATVLATNQPVARALHKDATNLYFSLFSGNGVATMPLSGGTPTMLATAGLVSDIAVDGTDLFYASQQFDGVYKIDTMGNQNEILLLHPMGEEPYAVAADANNVYWTANPPSLSLPNASKIYVIPR